jgi:membrane protein DedA with SNARE-associated domain
MNIITSLLSHLNYGTIFFLMLLESTVIPVPSELVVSPAAYHAAGGSLNIWLVILFATLGADCGATINYVAGYYLGRPIIYKFANSKWGKMCLLNQEKVEKSERYFDKHGMMGDHECKKCEERFIFILDSIIDDRVVKLLGKE